MATRLKEKHFVALLLGIIYLTYLIWGLSSNATWDDDCLARYYGALHAFGNPSNFTNVFLRPLWILLFSIPAHLGRWIIPVLMSGIASLTAYALYRSAKLLNLNYAWLVMPFLLLQPFFFGVGRDAETEPLAACLIAVGYWMLLRKKYLAFAILGAWLPLARVELSIFLVIWAILLWQQKAWRYIPILGAGLLVWNVAGMMIDGEFNLLWLMDAIQDRGAGEENPYGHQSFATYFERYLYVTGPVVFCFLLLGIINRLKQKKIDGFVTLQFFLGMLLYTLFAWKLNIGKSAGFLRNLVPLSPLVALLALHGFNWVMDVIHRKEKPYAVLIAASSVLTIGIIFFRHSLEKHHFLTEQFDPFNVPLLGLTFLLGMGAYGLYHQEAKIRIQIGQVYGGLIVTLLLFHTLISEPPDANINPQRKAVERLSETYWQSNLHQHPTYANHAWFFWINNIDPEHTEINSITPEALQAAPLNSVVLWDSHYARPRKGGVESTFFGAHGFTELFRLNARDNTFVAIVFQKTNDLNMATQMEAINQLIASNPNLPHPYLGRSAGWSKQGKVEEAMADIDRALVLAPDVFEFCYAKAQLLSHLQQFEEAIVWYSRSLDNSQYHFMSNIGRANAYMHLKQHDKALQDFNTAIALKPTSADFYFFRSKAHQVMGNLDAACQDLTIAANNKYPVDQVEYKRVCCGR